MVQEIESEQLLQMYTQWLISSVALLQCNRTHFLQRKLINGEKSRMKYYIAVVAYWKCENKQ